MIVREGIIWHNEINISFKCNFIAFLVIGLVLELVFQWRSRFEVILGGLYLCVLCVEGRYVHCTLVTPV